MEYHVLEAIEKLKEDAGKTTENGHNQPPENSGGYKKDIDSMFIQGVYKDSKGINTPAIKIIL